MKAQHADRVDLRFEGIVCEYELGNEEASVTISSRDTDVAGHYCYRFAICAIGLLDVFAMLSMMYSLAKKTEGI